MRVEVGGGLVVADRRVGGAAVIGEPAGVLNGSSTETTCGLSPIFGERRADRGLRLEPAVAGAEDERGLGARLGREALLEEVLGLLGLDARDGEVVLERAAGGDGAADRAP